MIRRERGIGAAGIVIVSRRVSVGAQLLNTVLCVDYGVVIHVPLWYCMGSAPALVRRGEGCQPRCWVKYGFGDQGRGSRVCVRARTREARPCVRIAARRCKC